MTKHFKDFNRKLDECACQQANSFQDDGNAAGSYDLDDSADLTKINQAIKSMLAGEHSDVNGDINKFRQKIQKFGLNFEDVNIDDESGTYIMSLTELGETEEDEDDEFPPYAIVIDYWKNANGTYGLDAEIMTDEEAEQIQADTVATE